MALHLMSPETGLGNRGVGVMFFEIGGQHMASLPIENALFEQGKGIQITRLFSRFLRFPRAPAFAGNWKSGTKPPTIRF